MERIYLDHAASTPIREEVWEAMRPYLIEYPGNPSSTHAHGRQLRNAIEDARRTVANGLGVSPGEIVFTSGGTESDNTALRGAVEAYQIEQIISTPLEHHAVGHCIEALVQEGKVSVHWLNVDAEGQINLTELDRVLGSGKRSLVSLMHANNEIGTIYDIQAIGQLCQQHEALFHSDTVQSMANLPLDLSQIPVDFVVASAHKFNGPKGIGLLYIRKGRQLPRLITGGGQERGHRAGTENVAAIVGLAKAFSLCQDQLPAKEAHVRSLKQHMKQQLVARFPGIRVNGAQDEAQALPNVLNVTFPDTVVGDGMLLFELDLEGISVSGGSACSSGAQAGSHVLSGIGVSAEEIGRSVRFSFGWQNTKAEIDIVVGKLQAIVGMPVK